MSIAAVALWAALEASAEDGGCTIDLVGCDSVDLGSGCIVDHWHRVTMLVGGDRARAWLDGLDEDAVRVDGFALVQLEVGCLEPQHGRLLVDVEALTVREA